MTVLGLATATFIVLVAVAMATPVGQINSCDSTNVACQGRVQLLSFTAFGMPGLVMAAVLVRLSAATRSTQAQGLRLLGVSRVSLVGAVVTESFLLTVAGSAVGGILAVAVSFGLRVAGNGVGTWLSASAAALGMGLVIVWTTIAAVISARPDLGHHRVTRTPRWWRVLPDRKSVV
jgi:hypothetical protein